MPLRHKISILYLLALAGLLLISCNQHRDKAISFYYWRTGFHLDSSERETLAYNQVSTLYVRYFDIDFTEQDSVPKLVSPIHFDSASLNTGIIPVVFIKNRTFEKLDSAGVIDLAQQVNDRVKMINQAQGIHPMDIQFDCDWTERTRDRYFIYLKQFKQLANTKVAATIRLHQIKYREKTGIPPVDQGVLMYYNMGDIGPGKLNSIYDKAIADKYISYLHYYPLHLDIALPIFSWGIQIREGKVVKLLNKMNFNSFQNDSNFIKKDNWFLVKHACFLGGYYFRENDQVKIEYVSKDDLLGMASTIKKYTNHKIDHLIFYDLDKENTQLYEKDIFKEVQHQFD